MGFLLLWPTLLPCLERACCQAFSYQSHKAI
jgi:hypothetical protein